MATKQRAAADTSLKGDQRNPQWLDKREKQATQQPLSTVKRWRAGQAPEWAKEEHQEEDEEQEGRHEDRQPRIQPPEGPVAEVVEKKSEGPSKSATDRIKEALEAAGEEDDEDRAMEERRRKAREKAMRQQQPQEEDAEELLHLPKERADKEEEEEEEEDDEEEEETSDSEDEEGPRLARPVFVPKVGLVLLFLEGTNVFAWEIERRRANLQEKRETQEEREQMLREQEGMERQEEERKERIREQSKSIVEQEREMQEKEAKDDEDTETARLSDVDTDDDVDAEEEYQLWKAREMERVRREKAIKEGRVHEEAEETKRMRQLSENERNAIALERAKQPGTKTKQKLNFMQKYYHKGAYFQEDPDDPGGTAGTHDIIHERDYNEATGEDKFDKSILPRPMQVRKNDFGFRGQSKWTHLTNEDTTLKFKNNSLFRERKEFLPDRDTRFSDRHAAMQSSSLTRPSQKRKQGRE